MVLVVSVGWEAREEVIEAVDLNKETLIGNVVHTPRSRKPPSGDTAASFSVATNYTTRDPQTKEVKQQVDYRDVVAWGRLADVVAQHLGKGTKVYVEGRLKHRDYTGQDGTRVKKAEILLSHLIMLSPKPERPVEEKLAPVEPEVPVETEA